MGRDWRYGRVEHPECPLESPNPVKLLNVVLDCYYGGKPFGKAVEEAFKARRDHPELFELDDE
jgi:hypothetical protein